MRGPWGSTRSGDLEQGELVFGHFPFQSLTIRNAGHSKQTPAHALWETMETCSIGESAQKKDQGSREGDGETETQQRNWRRRYPADTGCSRAVGLNQRVAYSYPAYQIFTL